MEIYKVVSVSIFALTVDSVILDVVDSDKLKGVLEDDDDELTGPLLDSGSEEEDIGICHFILFLFCQYFYHFYKGANAVYETSSSFF